MKARSTRIFRPEEIPNDCIGLDVQIARSSSAAKPFDDVLAILDPDDCPVEIPRASSASSQALTLAKKIVQEISTSTFKIDIKLAPRGTATVVPTKVDAEAYGHFLADEIAAARRYDVIAYEPGRQRKARLVDSLWRVESGSTGLCRVYSEHGEIEEGCLTDALSYNEPTWTDSTTTSFFKNAVREFGGIYLSPNDQRSASRVFIDAANAPDFLRWLNAAREAVPSLHTLVLPVFPEPNTAIMLAEASVADVMARVQDELETLASTDWWATDKTYRTRHTKLLEIQQLHMQLSDRLAPIVRRRSRWTRRAPRPRWKVESRRFQFRSGEINVNSS